MLDALLHSADDLFNSDGAWWILALDGILLIALVFAVFFPTRPKLDREAVQGIIRLDARTEIVKTASRLDIGPGGGRDIYMCGTHGHVCAGGRG